MDTQATIIRPQMITWARERSGITQDAFASRMSVSLKRVKEWEEGVKSITMRQAKQLCELALIPFGYLFLDELPEQRVSLPDFRSVNNRPVSNLTPELEATILDMQEKQSWMRDYLEENGYDKLDFVGSISLNTPIKEAARKIKDALGMSLEQRECCRNWDDYFRCLSDMVEDAGVTLI